MKPITRSKAEVVDELKRFVMAWRTTHRLTDQQVVAYLVIAASGAAESAYVTLAHQAPPKAQDEY